MGFLRKVSGTQDQIDSVNRNAAAQEAATRQAATNQQAALMQSAKATADQQSQLAARAAVEATAAENAAKPLENADVQLSPDATESAAGKRRNTRAQYGKNYASSGVQI